VSHRARTRHAPRPAAKLFRFARRKSACEGDAQKLQDVSVSGNGEGMQKGMVSPVEAYMKAIDKNRFRAFLGDDADKVL